MARQIVLLRGINLGSRNRISMPELRDALERAGLDDVRTYLQSGNAVVSSTAAAARVGRSVEKLIADEFGLDPNAIPPTDPRDRRSRTTLPTSLSHSSPPS